MRNIIFSFIAVGEAAFCDFFVVDLSAATDDGFGVNRYFGGRDQRRCERNSPLA